MKRKITLQEAYNLVGQADAIIVDNNGLCYHSLWELTGEANNEWLFLSWADADFDEFNVKFIEEEQDIFFDGTTITMKDSEDDEVNLKLLVPMNTVINQ